MIVVDKEKTLKVCMHYSFSHLAERLAELIGNTITAVSNHISREWSCMNQDNLSFPTMYGMNIYV